MGFCIYKFSVKYITRGKLAPVVGSATSEHFGQGSIPLSSIKFEIF